jgi:hypothetical protein
MARNWVTAWFSKIWKGPWIVRQEMRHEERKIFHILRHMRFLIYEKIPKEVRVNHQVSKGLMDQKAAGKDAQRSVKEEEKLAFNAEVIETLSLKEIEQAQKAELQHIELHGPIGVEAEQARKSQEILASIHDKERKTYLKWLEPIIKEAEGGVDLNALMAQVRRLGPNQLQVLSAVALRFEIRAAGRGVSKLRVDKKLMQKALAEWDSAKHDKEKAEEHLKVVLVQMNIDMENALTNDGQVIQRDFLLALLTLRFINDDELFMTQYYKDNVMPKIPEELRIKELQEVKNHLADYMHTLAQGMRRILAQEERAEKMAKQIEAVARTRRRAA